MALDETTEKLYRAADTSTLLALLPVLRSQIEHAKAEMKVFERSDQISADADAQIAEIYGELFAAFDTRIGDDPKDREALRNLRDKFNSTMASLHKNDEHYAQFTNNFLRYLTDLANREHWIIDEMKRQGYLPLFPGEEPSL